MSGLCRQQGGIDAARPQVQYRSCETSMDVILAYSKAASIPSKSVPVGRAIRPCGLLSATKGAVRSQATGAVKRRHRVKGKPCGLMTDGWLQRPRGSKTLSPAMGVGGPITSRFTNNLQGRT